MTLLWSQISCPRHRRGWQDSGRCTACSAAGPGGRCLASVAR